MSKNFKCLECGNSYEYNRTLRKHVKKSHPLKLSSYKNAVPVARDKCPLCEVVCYERNQILDHLSNEHQIDIENEDANFSTMDEFITWKDSLEEETSSKFIKKTGTQKNAAGDSINYYSCHRSGHYVATGNGRRKLKNRGSNKIGGTCPASIKLTISKIGKCSVHFIKTHVGHKNDVGHLSLKSADRDLIAAKVSAKIPFDTILSEMRDSAPDCKRMHLLTKQDLYNIDRRTNLSSSSVSHTNDTISVQEFFIQCVNDCHTVPSGSLLVQLSKVKEEETLGTTLGLRKENALKTLSDILAGISTTKQMVVVEQCLTTINPTLAAIHQETALTLNSCNQDISLQPNIKIIKQSGLLKSKNNKQVRIEGNTTSSTIVATTLIDDYTTSNSAIESSLESITTSITAVAATFDGNIASDTTVVASCDSNVPSNIAVYNPTNTEL